MHTISLPQRWVAVEGCSQAIAVGHGVVIVIATNTDGAHGAHAGRPLGTAPSAFIPHTTGNQSFALQIELSGNVLGYEYIAGI